LMSVREWVVLDHLDRMSDSTGLIQHAIYNVPRRESGYTTDDNDKRSPNEAGQFDPVDKIIRHYPDPKIPVADPEGETALLTVADE